MPPPAARAYRRWVWGILACAGSCLLAAILLPWYFRGRIGHPNLSVSAPDPRVLYAGPFRNVRPEVAYVPDARCSDCHAEIAAAFAEHPMGRSLFPVAQAPAPPEDVAHHNPFEALGSRFSVGRGNNKVWQRETLTTAGSTAAELEWEVHYVLGSGARGHSYLTDRGGYLYQTPVSWFSQKQVWDLSPGFIPSLRTGRTVLAGCLFCHANRARHVSGSVNRYEEPPFDGHAIGCQRCHGPGTLHLDGPGQHDPSLPGADVSIVNPGRLPPALREAVCEQCHLVGKALVTRRGRDQYDFRPGLAAEQIWSVFVAAEEGRQKAVGHVEGMYQSHCFQASDGPGRLGCVSCHDPHRRISPDRRVAYYRGRCLQCHQEHGCALPRDERLRRNREDSCIDCHMPRYNAPDVAHTASTDHSVPRNSQPFSQPPVRKVAGDVAPVASFYAGRSGTDAAEDERDLAVALIKMARQGETGLGVAAQALPVLESAAGRDPHDLEAAESLGYALGMRNRWPESLATFCSLLEKDPGRELSLLGAAAAAEAGGELERARDYWRRVAASNPWRPDYRRDLVQVLFRAKRWGEAQPECDAWVRLDPFSAEARTARVQCLLAAGEKEAARTEFARLETLAPDNLVELRARFRRKLQ